MPVDLLPDGETIISRPLENLANSEKPTIRILLYTDDKIVARETGPSFGLGEMIRHLETRPPAFANLSIKLECRYPPDSTAASRKVNVVLNEAEDAKKPFDQVWFFGIHQINKEQYEPGLNGGGPESELDKLERDALETRMNEHGLGVLVTGDHANKRPGSAIPNKSSPCRDEVRNDPYLGLGRALGRCIPRAGMMRDWEGDPTSDPRHSFNTQVVTVGADLEQIAFQQDFTPQQLILKTFNERGKASLGGRPHPLFFYRQGAPILLFPDHLHEGAVKVPEKFPVEMWPETHEKFQPKPRVVAYGVDKRNARKLKLIAVYDGDLVDVGRIVADSTWHHYFNVNLTFFPAPAEPRTVADVIGQYYANLAIWLTPREKRSQMADALTLWIERHPEIGELVGPDPSKLLSDVVSTGSIANKRLAEVASDCEVHELLQMVVPRGNGKRYESLYFPEENRNLSPVPSKELLLGSLIHKVPADGVVLRFDPLTEAGLTFRRNAIAKASSLAFKRQKRRVEETVRQAIEMFPDA